MPGPRNVMGAFVVSALGVVPLAADAQEVTWRFATVVQESHCLYPVVVEEIAEELASATDGRMEVEIYPAMQLGGEREMLQGMQTGTIDAAIWSDGILGAFVPEFRFVNLPFLIAGPEHWRRIVETEEVQALFPKAEEQGIYMFALKYFGPRILNLRSKLIESPEDFEGLTLRTMENPVHISTAQALGASPEPIPFPELYNALRMRVVDAMYNDAAVFTTRSTYEVAPYVTHLPLFTGLGGVGTSKISFDSLPEDLKPLVRDTFEAAAESMEACTISENEAAIQYLLDNDLLEGYNTIDDLAPYREMVMSVYEAYLEDSPDQRAVVEAALAAQ